MTQWLPSTAAVFQLEKRCNTLDRYAPVKKRKEDIGGGLREVRDSEVRPIYLGVLCGKDGARTSRTCGVVVVAESVGSRRPTVYAYARVCLRYPHRLNPVV